MKLQIMIEVLKRGHWYLARAPELDFVSQGRTVEEAKRNLLEVVEIQFAEMRESGTLEDYLSECGFEMENGRVIPNTDIVGFEKSIVSV